MTKIINVPITKAKSSIAVDVDTIDIAVYESALSEGLKVLVNGGMTKITKENIPDEEARKVEAQRIAEERVQAMIDGSFKTSKRAAAAGKGPSAQVLTEARRLARILVKEALKAKGLKVTHYTSSEITQAANEIIAADPSIIDTATKNLEARSMPAKPTIDPTDHMKADPKLVAAEEAKKAERKAGPLSKTQAGKVAPRAHVPAH